MKRACLKKMVGRFGNNLFRYMFLRTFAARHNMSCVCPKWIGHNLFGLSEPDSLVTDHAVEYDELGLPGRVEKSIVASLEQSPETDVIFSGYFTYHTSYYAPYRSMLREAIHLRSDAAEHMFASVRALSDGRPIAVIHLRRGDAMEAPKGSCYEQPPDAWYEKWLDAVTFLSPDVLVYVATDDAIAIPECLGRFRYKTAADLSVETDPAFVTDWFMLGLADYVMIAPSTFGFLATMFGPNTEQQCWRPDMDAGRVVRYDPWDAFPNPRE